MSTSHVFDHIESPEKSDQSLAMSSLGEAVSPPTSRGYKNFEILSSSLIEDIPSSRKSVVILPSQPRPPPLPPKTDKPPVYDT